MLKALAIDMFGERSSMPYKDLISTLISTLKISDKTAERKVSEMKSRHVIEKSFVGMWIIKS